MWTIALLLPSPEAQCRNGSRQIALGISHLNKTVRWIQIPSKDASTLYNAWSPRGPALGAGYRESCCLTSSILNGGTNDS